MDVDENDGKEPHAALVLLYFNVHMAWSIGNDITLSWSGVVEPMPTNRRGKLFRARTADANQEPKDPQNYKGKQNCSAIPNPYP